MENPSSPSPSWYHRKQFAAITTPAKGWSDARAVAARQAAALNHNMNKAGKGVGKPAGKTLFEFAAVGNDGAKIESKGEKTPDHINRNLSCVIS